MRNPNFKAGSAILITVIVIGLVTSMALSSMVVKFDQFSSTSRINDSSVAKSAADAAIAKIKSKYDDNNESQIQKGAWKVSDTASYGAFESSDTFKPQPSQSVYSIETRTGNLLRCTGVAVISPWVQSGKYLYTEDDTSNQNPALIFNWANIVNNTTFDDVNSNSDSEMIRTVSQQGNFFNPFAPLGSKPSEAGYWTVNMGGPNDAFLNKYQADGITSIYSTLDLLYIPYLPRFTDSILYGSAATRDAIRARFENLVNKSGLRVWLDAAVTDEDLQQYGLADLFTGTADDNIKWLQPRLWNDVPEIGLTAEDLGATNSSSGSFVASSASTTSMDNWAPTNNNTVQVAVGDNYNVDIVKGSKPEGYLNVNQVVGNTIKAYYFGTLNGLRIGKTYNLADIKLNNVSFTTLAKLTKVTKSSDLSLIEVEFQNLSGNNPAQHDIMGISGDPQPSTYVSTVGMGQAADGSLTLSNPNCLNYTCVAKGDIVNLTNQSNQDKAPIWGVVTEVAYSNNLNGLYKIARPYGTPKPVRDFASVYKPAKNATDYDGVVMFGGQISENYYPGGDRTGLNEVWVYKISDNTWHHVKTTGSIPRLVGASISFSGNNFLITGGFSYEKMGTPCDSNSTTCKNEIGNRYYKKFSTSVYKGTSTYGLGGLQSVAFTEIPSSTSTVPVNHAVMLTKVLSTLPERSGTEGGEWVVAANNIVINGGETNKTFVTSSLNGAIGFSKKDNIKIQATSGGNSITFWGVVTGISGSSQIIADLSGINVPSAGISLSNLKITQYRREIGSNFCIDYDSSDFSCGVDSNQGFSLGDLVVFEKDTMQRMEKEFYGYVVKIDGNRIKYSLKEPDADNYGSATPQAPALWPAPRWGHNSTFTDDNTLVLWEGGSGETSVRARYVEVWKGIYSDSASTLSWSLADYSSITDGIVGGNENVIVKPISYPSKSTATSIGSINPGSPLNGCLNLNGSCDINTSSVNFTIGSSLTVNATYEQNGEIVPWAYHCYVTNILNGKISVTSDSRYPLPPSLPDSANIFLNITTEYPALSEQTTAIRSGSTSTSTLTFTDNSYKNIPVGSTLLMQKNDNSQNRVSFYGYVVSRSVNLRELSISNVFIGPLSSPGQTNICDTNDTNKTCYNYSSFPSTYLSSGSNANKAKVLKWSFVTNGSYQSWKEETVSTDYKVGPRQFGGASYLNREIGGVDTGNSFVTAGTNGPLTNVYNATNNSIITPTKGDYLEYLNTSGGAFYAYKNNAGKYYYISIGGQIGARTDLKYYGTKAERGKIEVPGDGAEISSDAQPLVNSIKEISCADISFKSYKYLTSFYLSKSGDSSLRTGGLEPASNCSAVTNKTTTQSTTKLGNRHYPSRYYPIDTATSPALINNSYGSIVGLNGNYSQSSTTSYLYPEGSYTKDSLNNKNHNLTFASYKKLAGGGYILATPLGVGNGIINDKINMSVSGEISGRYTGTVYKNVTTDLLNVDHIDWVPDGEDVALLMNAAVYFNKMDTYKITGYYAGTRRAYILKVENLGIEAGKTKYNYLIQEVSP